MFKPPNPHIQSTDSWKWVQSDLNLRSPANEYLLPWLKNQTNEVWHFVMESYNWDHGIEIPRWIVTQENCDEATALLVYFLASPSFFIRHPGHRDVDLVRHIGTAFKAGQYKQRNFRSEADPRFLEVSKTNFELAVSESGLPDWAIEPSKQLENTEGTVPRSEYLYYGGFPRFRRAARVPSRPAVPVSRSVTDDYVFCLDCGLPLKLIERHLRFAHKLKADVYKEKWGLHEDYPLVAPSYARETAERLPQLFKDRAKP